MERARFGTFSQSFSQLVCKEEGAASTTMEPYSAHHKIVFDTCLILASFYAYFLMRHFKVTKKYPSNRQWQIEEKRLLSFSFAVAPAEGATMALATEMVLLIVSDCGQIEPFSLVSEKCELTSCRAASRELFQKRTTREMERESLKRFVSDVATFECANLQV